jgi:peptidoglycan/xylan/chitin deacetylase (PgdA/CDA1 family)
MVKLLSPEGLGKSQNQEQQKYHLAHRNPLRRAASETVRAAQITAARCLRNGIGFRCWDAFGILMYHRVTPVPALGTPPTWNVTPEQLKMQLGGLLDRGFEPWRLVDMVEASRRGNRVPRNAFAVTFDDGYACLLDSALPVLRDLDVPATIFLVTGYVGNPQPLPFDDWPGKHGKPEARRSLNLQECRKLLASGLVDFGSHTHRHLDYRGRASDFRQDMADSFDYLSGEMGLKERLFAFPYGIPKAGFCTPEFFSIARALGAHCAITAEERLANNGAEPFGWGRMLAAQQDHGGSLAAKLSGWYRAWSQ